ncbi:MULTISPECIES: hypothetical protein [Vitreoscilla]|uniref:Uncharacterized protein n=1 Tax=Vitreoscilla stercoraria TaxID=61 RepID=A0ABY4EJW8_VITST|nr:MULTISPECIES: hypothetical protein [Vitreoscilla]AUZ05045.1 hypothetical protein ADP71_14410 [Vitreoscilla sp. C1]UOO93642.1 hypothetical protein LVJ81_06355 [Vitreoscilla stercoraria]
MYEESKQRAIKHGYIRYENYLGYNGEVYVKNKKIWIHNIEALKHELGYTNDNNLIELGYNVDDYYRYNV